MTEKIYNKLVRDLIPQVIERAGHVPEVRKLSDEEFVSELKKKLVEEALEVAAAESHEKLVGELADVREVLLALYETEGVTDAEVEAARLSKLEERGGFSEKLMLEKVIEQDTVGA